MPSLHQYGARKTALVEEDPIREHLNKLDLPKFMGYDRKHP